MKEWMTSRITGYKTSDGREFVSVGPGEPRRYEMGLKTKRDILNRLKVYKEPLSRVQFLESLFFYPPIDTHVTSFEAVPGKPETKVERVHNIYLQLQPWFVDFIMDLLLKEAKKNAFPTFPNKFSVEVPHYCFSYEWRLIAQYEFRLHKLSALLHSKFLRYAKALIELNPIVKKGDFEQLESLFGMKNVDPEAMLTPAEVVRRLSVKIEYDNAINSLKKPGSGRSREIAANPPAPMVFRSAFGSLWLKSQDIEEELLRKLDWRLTFDDKTQQWVWNTNQVDFGYLIYNLRDNWFVARKYLSKLLVDMFWFYRKGRNLSKLTASRITNIISDSHTTSNVSEDLKKIVDDFVQDYISK